MLELSVILLAGATLILPSDWRRGLLWWLRLRKLAAGQPVVFLAFAAMVFAAACVGAWWTLVSAAQGPGYLSSSKWPKGGASSA
jgi:hypothetical protein